ncbi:MAG: anti-sigma factor [Chloroflexota bacterium]|nr:zf-HC2 domain-containing protein [Caldilinea sp.]GIK71337.1 MAG: anti-sigma factor [Chloroflexota bacterium]
MNAHELHGESHGESHSNCKHLLADLSDYLDGEAAAEVCAEIERHLADCADCRAVVDTLRKTIHLYRTLPQPTLSPDARSRLFAALSLPK